MNQTLEFTIIEEDQDSRRLDVYLVNKLPSLSRSQIKTLFKDSKIISNFKIQLNRMPPTGTKIIVHLPEEESQELQGESITLNIVFEDEHLIIINKQEGLVIHPGAGISKGTLVNALIHHYPPIREVGETDRPGIVHRLDKGTTGLIIVAKTQECYEGLITLFKEFKILKVYHALLYGRNLSKTRKIETLFSRSPSNRLKMTSRTKVGKEALTYFNLLENYERIILGEFKLETGRTHQIRVHASEVLDSPIVNDPLYGKRNEERTHLSKPMLSLLKEYSYPLLHARKLAFEHPITHEFLEFEAEYPSLFQECLKILKAE